MSVMEVDVWAVADALGLVEMVVVFFAQVVDIMTAEVAVFFVMEQERMNAFHVEEEDIRTAMNAMAQVS